MVADGSAWSPSKTLRFDPSAKTKVHRSCRAEMDIEPFKAHARAMLDPPATPDGSIMDEAYKRMEHLARGKSSIASRPSLPRSSLPLPR